MAEVFGDTLVTLITLTLTLQMLRDTVKDPPGGRAGGVKFERTSSLMPTIEICKAHLDNLEKKLAPCASPRGVERLWWKASWPLRWSETVEVVKTLGRFVVVFEFAVTVDGM